MLCEYPFINERFGNISKVLKTSLMVFIFQLRRQYIELKVTYPIADSRILCFKPYLVLYDEHF